MTYHNDVIFLKESWPSWMMIRRPWVTEEQILKLSGGGDWHVAYILLYGPETDVPIETTATSDHPEKNN